MRQAPSSVMWFRRDLRLDDHPALSAAAAEGGVVCLFVVDPGILARRHHRSPARLRFLRAGLEALAQEIASRGGRLVVREGAPEEVVPAVAAEAGARVVHVTRDRSPLGRARDRRVADALAREGVRLADHGGDLVAEPEDVAGSSGAGYRVFTPFFRALTALPTPLRVEPPARLDGPSLPSAGLGRLPAGDPPLPAGPRAARERLVDFVRSGAADAYGERRDLPAAGATSHLSAHLRLGMCSPGQVARALGPPGGLDAGRAAFWRQVGWREFSYHLLVRAPEMARTSLRPDLRGVRWERDARGLAAWTRGETGYPLVDAAMRQLAAEGWVHNRARLVAASFLVKDLLVDWRRGETVFMQGLVDGDPANNNQGWQWTAGTGADAAPYFRVFNPVLQARRFDPVGDYVRRYVPELRDVPAAAVHEPWRMGDAEQRAARCRIGTDYPAPIVDHAMARARALERYRGAGGVAA